MSTRNGDSRDDDGAGRDDGGDDNHDDDEVLFGGGRNDGDDYVRHGFTSSTSSAATAALVVSSLRPITVLFGYWAVWQHLGSACCLSDRAGHAGEQRRVTWLPQEAATVPQH